MTQWTRIMEPWWAMTTAAIAYGHRSHAAHWGNVARWARWARMMQHAVADR